MRKLRLVRSSLVALLCLVVAPAVVAREDPPDVPAALQVPVDSKLKFSADAVGVQIYDCRLSASSYAWVFRAPSATLFDEVGNVIGTHYAGPTWELNNGSFVRGAVIARYTPDPTAIPWLRLGAVANSSFGRMKNVTNILRLNTAGGVAPAGGCDASTVGSTEEVPYIATYYFYKD